jgi:hypothetical protein
MFNAWEQDNQYKIDQCLDHDFSLIKQFKASKMTKPADRDKLMDVIRANYLELKEIAIFLQSSSKYPNINGLDFVKYCKTLDFMDQRVTVSRID